MPCSRIRSSVGLTVAASGGGAALGAVLDLRFVSALDGRAASAKPLPAITAKPRNLRRSFMSCPLRTLANAPHPAPHFPAMEMFFSAHRSRRAIVNRSEEHTSELQSQFHL